jgi:hypothetical protein
VFFAYSFGHAEKIDESAHHPRSFGFEPTSLCMRGSANRPQLRGPRRHRRIAGNRLRRHPKLSVPWCRMGDSSPP